MRRMAIILMVALCASASLATTSRGEEPKPEDLLRQMANFYADLPALSCRIHLSIAIQARGMDHRTDMKAAVRLERPNRFALRMDEGVMPMTVVSDGKQIWQYMPMLNRYTVQDAPEDMSELAEGERAGGLMMMGGIPAMIPADGEEFYNKLTAGLQESQYLGEEQLGDVNCHRCRFVSNELSWDIWIETGDRPLVHKIVPDMSQQFAEAGEMFKDAQVEYFAEFSDWDVAPKFTDADFTFVPPADAEQVESLQEGLAEFRGAPDEGPHPLLGQPAPSFETIDVDGQPIDLAKHVGQDIVMLDFWATWCGPCVRAMPELETVAKKFADRGVVFYAVNVQEDAETIKEFLEASELQVPVAMDPDGKINGLYKVEGIPQTVLVGKDGSVQVVHIGFSPDLGEQLTRNIEDLLAGKDLASPILAEAEKTAQKEAAEEEPAESAP